MDRRALLQSGLAAGTLALSGTAWARQVEAAEPALIPIRTGPAEVFRTTVCLRPFRAMGPRIEAERLGHKTVVHNYGHGGSGWSLSWGSAAEAVRLALESYPGKPSSPKKIAVIGAGAIGLTAAITAQRAGADVTVYARERFPYVRSARATGSWTPDSRVAKTAAVAPGFGDFWERMARTSLAMHQSFIGVAGNPVEWMDYYILRDAPQASAPPADAAPDPGFIELNSRLADSLPHGADLPADGLPFAAASLRRNVIMTFNVTDYSHQLESDFEAAGGRFEYADFQSPADLLKLKEQVLINCTGYGARALWKDESLTPVRGQIVWLTPQEGVHYGMYHQGLSVLARRDGIVVQALGPDDNFGFGDDNETADPAAAQAAVDQVKSFYKA
jgi:glycine/D-amino acid oxidase-like deaminating enzyme